MPKSNRRRFMGISLAGVAGLASPLGAGPSGVDVAAPHQDAEIGSHVTRTLARWVLAARFEDLPAPVRKEAQRTLLNWIGCASGGSRHETIDAAVAALAPFAGPPQASVLGRRERTDILLASLLNGMSSHVFDFDDTHLQTV